MLNGFNDQGAPGVDTSSTTSIQGSNVLDQASASFPENDTSTNLLNPILLKCLEELSNEELMALINPGLFLNSNTLTTQEESTEDQHYLNSIFPSNIVAHTPFIAPPLFHPVTTQNQDLQPSLEEDTDLGLLGIIGGHADPNPWAIQENAFDQSF